MFDGQQTLSHTPTNLAYRLTGFGRNCFFLFLSDKLHKLPYRNLQLSLYLPEKKTPNPTQPVFVKRAYDTFEEPGLDLMPLSFR